MFLTDPTNAALIAYRVFEKAVDKARFEVTHPGENYDAAKTGVALAAGAVAVGSTALAGAGAAGIGAGMVSAMEFAKNFVSKAIPELIKMVLKHLGNTPIGKMILGALNPLKSFMAALGKKAAKAVLSALGLPSVEIVMFKREYHLETGSLCSVPCFLLSSHDLANSPRFPPLSPSLPTEILPTTLSLISF